MSSRRSEDAGLGDRQPGTSRPEVAWATGSCDSAAGFGPIQLSSRVLHIDSYPIAETCEILGAGILGVGGDEAIPSVLDVMYAQAPYTVMQRAVHIHPTVSELIPTMLGELQPLVP